MVATVAVTLFHAPPVVASVNCVVLPAHKVVVPPIAAITGNAFTVTVADTESVQPLPLVTVYLIIEEPAATPVTRPVEFTVAAERVTLFHVPPVVVYVN